MHYEVEQKFRVASLEPKIAALTALSVEIAEPVKQVDCYYRHPGRDFAQTDEAFRLRTVGTRNCMTYKGPKIDQETKTRLEEEVPLADGQEAWNSCDAILRHLGFEPAATVSKQRRICQMQRGELSIEIALDQVEGLGEFIEIEVGVEAADIDDPAIQQARSALAELASELSLADVERRSYLELLLEQ